MREALVGGKTQTQIQRGSQRLRGSQLAKVGFEIGAGEDARDVLGETREIGRAALPQIPASQFVTPAGIGKLSESTLVDLLGLRAHLILLEERREPVV